MNIADALGDAIRAGMGIGMLPIPTALHGLHDGSLVQVLPHARLKPINVYALYARRASISTPRSRRSWSFCAMPCRNAWPSTNRNCDYGKRATVTRRRARTEIGR